MLKALLQGFFHCARALARALDKPATARSTVEEMQVMTFDSCGNYRRAMAGPSLSCFKQLLTRALGKSCEFTKTASGAAMKASIQQLPMISRSNTHKHSVIVGAHSKWQLKDRFHVSFGRVILDDLSRLFWQFMHASSLPCSI